MKVKLAAHSGVLCLVLFVFTQIISLHARNISPFHNYIRADTCKNDNQKPVPVTHPLISTRLEPNTGTITLNATNLNNGSHDNCAIDSIKVVRCSDVKTLGAPKWEEGKPTITFTCADNPPFVCIYFMVSDKNGNWDWTSAKVAVEIDPYKNTICGIWGDPPINNLLIIVQTENGDNVQSVTVTNGNLSAVTDESGLARLTVFPLFPYKLTLEKNIIPLNGISTYDLLLMNKHILGTQNLWSPYRYIAADVNKSGSISTLDVVELRKMVLGLNENFSNNKSWRFIDKSQVLTFDNVFTESLRETKDEMNLTANDVTINFIGIKVGDINGNAVPNSLLGSEARDFVSTLNFVTDEQNISAGQDVKIHFVADKAAEGFQFTLNYDKNALELLDVEGLNKENYAILDKGVMTASWNGNNDEKPNFTLIFKAKDSGLISKMLNLNSRITAAEAYTSDAQLMNVALNFGKTSIISDRFELYQNQPNPFNTQTAIGFNLPESTTVQLTIFDATGRRIKEIKENYPKGYSQFIINNLNYVGLLYYQLSTDKYTATRKMIME